ncbi:MAG: hypothetical protein AAGI48_08840 [Verrucomicrobiota bacterium]
MTDELLELQRCAHPDATEDTTSVLRAAGIPYRLSTTAASFDITSIGSGQSGEVVIAVRKENYKAARNALENASLKDELPDDHFLHEATPEELVQIVGDADEWSPFDVAHASRLLRERGIDLEEVEEKRVARIEALRTGKPAPASLIRAGWFFTVVGGFIGMGIAWSLCTMKEKTPYGTYFSYDGESREIGRRMQRVSVVLTILWAVAWLTRGN